MIAESGRPQLPGSSGEPPGSGPPAPDQAEEPSKREQPEGRAELIDAEDEYEYEEDFYGVRNDIADLLDSGTGSSRVIYYAPNGSINAGTVHGGQRVRNQSASGTATGQRVEAQEGPISAAEILVARAGFAEPAWFPAALKELDSGILFLTGPQGSGRRTAALNLLDHSSNRSMALRAVDGDIDLTVWQPGHTGTHGYLVDGLVPRGALKVGLVNHLRQLLHKADARMVIVLPDDPEIARNLERDLPVKPFSCTPPPPKAVFEARLEAAVPDQGERERLLGTLEPGLLVELLAPELVPAEVAELVAAVVESAENPTALTDIRDRLSFLAEGEVPALIKELRDDPDGLAFLLATCVFEGLDYRIVREEADRLLAVAEGALHSVVLPEIADRGSGGPTSGRQGEPQPNPGFVFRRSLEELLHTVRARRTAKEIRAAAPPHVVEPVSFIRHRQAEAVLRHVWREYGQLSGVLTIWMDKVPAEPELTGPVGRVAGMAAGWGGGRRALRHIRDFARSERGTSQEIAAYAMGVAAQDPVLAGEVKHWLGRWSTAQSPHLRCTVAYACGRDFGLARPDLAIRLLRRLALGLRAETEFRLDLAIRNSLVNLFIAGNQAVILRGLVDWMQSRGADADLALRTFPQLLIDRAWFQDKLSPESDFTEPVLEFVRRSLNDERLFEVTSRRLIEWCRQGAWADPQRETVELLLGELARDLQHGVFRLFVVIDRHDDPDLAGRSIVRRALASWRRGDPPPAAASHVHRSTP